LLVSQCAALSYHSPVRRYNRELAAGKVIIAEWPADIRPTEGAPWRASVFRASLAFVFIANSGSSRYATGITFQIQKPIFPVRKKVRPNKS
jgi:hypothetical protein